MTIRKALTIAGSDTSGGAGIQADLKTFSALGVYGTAVLTALTAQNTRGVTGVHGVPPEFVAEQLATLFADVEVHATKLGMLGTADVVRAVAAALAGRPGGRVVCDPVMVATSGDRLIDDAAVDVDDVSGEADDPLDEPLVLPLLDAPEDDEVDGLVGSTNASQSRMEGP